MQDALATHDSFQFRAQLLTLDTLAVRTDPFRHRLDTIGTTDTYHPRRRIAGTSIRSTLRRRSLLVAFVSFVTLVASGAAKGG